MGRIAFFVIIGILIWMLVRAFSRKQSREDNAVSSRSVEGEDMVACARCGVNLPRSEARVEAGAFLCRDNPRCRGPA